MIPNKKQIMKFMEYNYTDFIDQKTNEINCTQITEYAATYFDDNGYNVYLPGYEIPEVFYDCAFEIEERHNKSPD